jgi:hypothetical protein
VNALLGGSTAAIRQKFQGGAFWDGLYKGSIGGSVSYLGKRIGGERFDGSGFLGREIAAVGASMVANGSEGRGILGRVVLPFGPLRLYIAPGESSTVRIKIDLPGAVLVGYTATRHSSTIDWRSSLSAGAPVFIGKTSPYSAGRQAAGVVLLRERARYVLAHEQVHIGQYDFSFIAWGTPIERALWDRLPVGAGLGRYVDLGLDLVVRAGLDAMLRYDQRPWEWEAHFLSRTEALYHMGAPILR